jgi:8-oxo-dGTP diphosphatase
MPNTQSNTHTSDQENELANFRLALTTVDVVLFSLIDNKLQVLLIQRQQAPFENDYSLPGGIIDPNIDDSLESCAQRKLHDKIGSHAPYLEQVISVGSRDRDPRGWSTSVVYFALWSSESLAKSPLLQHSHWVEVNKLDEYELAFDHAILIQHALQRLSNKVRYTALPLYLMPKRFTLTELQRVFEVLLGRALEKKSFRRRFDAAKLLSETGDIHTAKGRPAALFQCNKENPGEYYFDRALIAN